MRHSLLVIAITALSSAHSCSRDASTDIAPTAAAPATGATAAAPAAAPAPAPAAAPREPVYRVPVDGLPSFGNPRALVTVVEFTDYECPFCRRADATIASLRAKYGDDLRVVLAARPLPMHDHARPAALAALAAAEQGRLEGMHARLFAGSLDEASLAAAARETGLEQARFDADRAGAATQALARSEQLADRLGVRGTPTFFVNGRRVVGAQPIDVFQRVVDAELAAARALVATGVRATEVYDRTIAQGAERVADAEPDHGSACAGGACNKDEGPVGEAVESVPEGRAPSRGSAWAPITIVEFSDFECPFSARAQATIQAVEKAHPGDVRVVFKNRPLPFHDHARLASRAALAAGEQGRFWEMHDRIFAQAGAGALDRPALEAMARAIGLDPARFARDLDDARLDARIDADGADADALKVEGTPTFFINGHRVVGAQPADVFEKAAAKSGERSKRN